MLLLLQLRKTTAMIKRSSNFWALVTGWGVGGGVVDVSLHLQPILVPFVCLERLTSFMKLTITMKSFYAARKTYCLSQEEEEEDIADNIAVFVCFCFCFQPLRRRNGELKTHPSGSMRLVVVLSPLRHSNYF